MIDADSIHALAAPADEVLSYLLQRDRLGEQVTVKKIVEHFQAKPYGWDLSSTEVVLAWLVGDVFARVLPTQAFPPMWANILVGVVGGVAGQMGDLFASMVKRHCGIKDFGTLFPGHGGMLDRMDSILFTAIIVYSYRVIVMTFIPV